MVASYLALGFNVLVGLGIPLGTLVWLLVKRRPLVLPFFVGALTFLLSQLLTRLPLLHLLGGQVWYVAFRLQYPVLYSLLLGLSAGLFEELGRYLAMLAMMKHRGYSPALAFGVGHGGLEAGLIGANNLLLLLAMPVAVAAAPALGLAAAGVERLFAMMIHIGLSVMVMRAVQRKRPLWLLLAILLHGLIDGLLGILQAASWSTWAIEGYIALWGILMLLFTLVSKPKAPVTAPKFHN